MNPARDQLFYDGHCGMCTRSARWIRRLDWLSRLDIRDSSRTDPAELPVRMETALEGIPMKTRRGAVLVGFPALRRALLQTPLGFFPACLMYLPGISHAGDGVYRRIAARRKRNFSCSAPTATGR